MKELLKKIPIKNVKEFIVDFKEFIDSNHYEIIESIKDTHDLSFDVGVKIEECVNEFAEYFLAKL